MASSSQPVGRCNVRPGQMDSHPSIRGPSAELQGRHRERDVLDRLIEAVREAMISPASGLTGPGETLWRLLKQTA